MYDAIVKGIKKIFPNLSELCVRHIKKRDEVKLEKLFTKVKGLAAEKSKSKSCIVTDIYGERRGSTYEYGLAESLTEEEFKRKLLSLEKRWESLCSGFYH